MVRGLIAVVAFAALAACAPGDAGHLSVDDAYTPEPPTADVAAVYALIRNGAARADTLLGVTAPGAGRAELHQQVTEGGLMFHMQPVASLPIPARDSVPLAPGGLHVMLFGLPQRPAVGDTIDLLFTFRNAGEVPARARVVSRAELNR